MFPLYTILPATSTLANANLFSTTQTKHYPHPLNTHTAPIQLHNYQPQLPDTDPSHASLEFTPPRKRNPFEWLFAFLRDGTTSVPASSNALGTIRKTSLFPQRQATGGLLSRTLKTSNDDIHPPSSSDDALSDVPKKSSSRSTPSTTQHIFPPWSTWKDWKKISLDFYIRLLDTPQYSRLRLKQTIAPLPIIKFKPVIDLAYRGPAKSPLTMHLDVKILDCIKYRVHTDGSSHLQVRAKAPMSDPRFTMDVIYERQLGTALDSVKITFRALDVAFLKAPNPGFGCKFPIRFNNGVKSTIRVKKFIDQTDAVAATTGSGPKSSPRGHSVTPKPRRPSHNSYVVSGAGSSRRSDYANTNRIGISGPIGVDIKLRCLEYRSVDISPDRPPVDTAQQNCVPQQWADGLIEFNRDLLTILFPGGFIINRVSSKTNRRQDVWSALYRQELLNGFQFHDEDWDFPLEDAVLSKHRKIMAQRCCLEPTKSQI